MKKVVLYWSNICVLHKYEKEYLDKLRDELLGEGIDLEVHYFGIGYPMRMSEAMREKDSPLPDMIISTDLEVFENRAIYSRYSNELYEISDWIPRKKDSFKDRLFEDRHLLPFICIPMMLYSATDSFKDATNASLLGQKTAYGGINNSAVKCVFKYFWSEYGKEEALDFLNGSHIFNMPIQSMQAVKTGLSDVALLPSIYALRADMKNFFSYVPGDGVIVLPSFCAVKKSLAENTARLLVSKILSLDFCNYFVKSGDLISLIDGTESNARNDLENALLLYPHKEWFDHVSGEEFYDAYCQSIPAAIRLTPSAS